MKIITAATVYMSESQAIFQQEYSFSEARSYQDRQKLMIGKMS